jgi:hypothetical protein
VRGYLFRTTTGGQLDDDGDGFGNACDPRLRRRRRRHKTGDWPAIEAEFGKDLSDETCDSFTSTDCDTFDADGVRRWWIPATSRC